LFSLILFSLSISYSFVRSVIGPSCLVCANVSYQ
jgi:hypothetical protein